MNTRQRGALSMLVGIVLLTGTACAGDPGGLTDTAPPPLTTPTPTAESTTTPQAADPAQPSTWIISEDGIGPIEVGGQLEATLATLPSDWTNDENCSWTAWWNAPDADYGVFFVRGTEADDAPIREISVYTAAESPAAVPSPVTAEGLGLGATKDEVLAAYPDAEEGAAQIGGGTWIRLAGDADAHVFFEFREGADVASDVVVTVGDQPSYEVCG